MYIFHNTITPLELEEIKNWQPSTVQTTSSLFHNEPYTTSPITSSSSFNQSNIPIEPNSFLNQTNNNISYTPSLSTTTSYFPNQSENNTTLLQTEINFLKHKLNTKKQKIKSLKNSITTLLNDNQFLKSKLSEMELSSQAFHIENQKALYKQSVNFDKEQELMNKITSLEQELTQKTEHISKISQVDSIKMKDMELMAQKCKDLETILYENKQSYNLTIEQIQKENDNYKEQLFTYDKIFEIFNYTMKRLGSVFPQLFNQNLDVKKPKEFQNVLLLFEKCIWDLNERVKLFQMNQYITANSKCNSSRKCQQPASSINNNK